MSETFFGETLTSQPSSSTRYTPDGPPLPARHGKDRPGVKLRSACDFCHAAKVKCSGGSACDRCQAQDLPCTYSVAMRAGKPKGSCNRKTLDKHARIRQQHAARQASLDYGWGPSATMEPGVNDATWFDGVLLGMGLQNQDQNTPGFDHLNYPSDSQPQCLLSPESLSDQSHCSIHPLTEESSFEGHFSNYNQVTFDMPDIDAFSNIRSTIPFSPAASPRAAVPNELEGQEICTCFADQTHALTRLYSIHRTVQLHANETRHSASSNLCRLDICIQHINMAIDASKSFLSCMHCSKESCSVLITVSCVQLVMRLYEYVVAEVQSTTLGSHTTTCINRTSSGLENAGGEISRMSCRLGDYEVSPEESVAIRRLVVRRALQKGRELLLALKRLSMGEDRNVDSSSASGTPQFQQSPDTRMVAKSKVTQSQGEALPKNDLTSADTAYVQQVVCRGDAVLDVFLRAVSPV